MNNYFSLTIEEQRQVLQAAEGRIGLPAQAIEKDLWVTAVLQIVFTLPFADKMIFKGGTSLSKVGKHISRFSEDIDLAVDRSIFGFGGNLTKKQIKKLRKESSIFVREEFYNALSDAIKQYGLDTFCTVEAEPDSDGDNTYPEPRKIWITYKSIIQGELDYLKPVVLLEIGARSLSDPYAMNRVKSLVEEIFPAIQTGVVDSEIATAVAGKTFLEKVFLLHELFSVAGYGANANRKSRHLYDLYQMMDKDFAIAAVKDDELWENIRHHREIFTSVKDVDYTPDIRKRIVLIPREDIISVWERDYVEMLANMIYGYNKPTFKQIIDKMQVLQDRIRK
ncbi:MAG: nucleotidyl transferase AbiEii/AbiGii toxin family protein [Bacteroidales bacterium]|nr:nucleotidyl transferase AbiEii/AbiGii toxin family protein [Bacteroidales bacterium]